MVATGRLPPDCLVWCQGMPQWQPAWSIAEFAAGPLPPPYPTAAEMAKKRPYTNAAKNCKVMFVVFVIMGAWLCVVAATTAFGRGPWRRSGGLGMLRSLANFMAVVGLGSALFAALYVPLRWRVIQALPRRSRTLGLVGAFGLMAILVLMFIGMLVR
jgi:hypothetical protein